MVQLLFRWVAGVIALFATIKIAEILTVGLALKGGWSTQGVGNAFIVILVLTLVNAFIRPIVRLLTLPLNCLTFGLFGLVINALMFWLVGMLDLGLTVKGFIPALFGSIVLSIISSLLNVFVSVGDKK
jgi:putative membrane protein